MKSLITIIIGFLGGVAFSVAYPDLANKLNGQREKLMNEGAEKALGELKGALDQKLADSKPTTGVQLPAGMNNFAGSSSAKGRSETADIVKQALDEKIAEVKSKK